MKINSIPVFYHIPKNSGTYIFSCFLNEAARHSRRNVRILKIMSEKTHVIAKFLILDDCEFLNNCNKFRFLNKRVVDVNIEDLTDDILQNLSVYSVFVEGRGFRYIKTLLEPLFRFLSAKFNLYKFTILREPFSREQSLYHYLTSDKSKHEPTHGRFTSSSFEEHLASKQLQDSWIIRNLSNEPAVKIITQKHFDEAREILKTINIYNIKDVEKVIEDILFKCFNVQGFDKKLAESSKNNSVYVKIKFNDLPPETQKIFNEKKYWELKLYEEFANKMLVLQ
jgi:hypothetical protein